MNKRLKAELGTCKAPRLRTLRSLDTQDGRRALGGKEIGAPIYASSGWPIVYISCMHTVEISEFHRRFASHLYTSVKK